MNGAQLTVNGTVVWSGVHTATLGLNTFVASTPYLYTGGDLVVNWCFDNSSYVSGSNAFECTLLQDVCQILVIYQLLVVVLELRQLLLDQ